MVQRLGEVKGPCDLPIGVEIGAILAQELLELAVQLIKKIPVGGSDRLEAVDEDALVPAGDAQSALAADVKKLLGQGVLQSFQQTGDELPSRIACSILVGAEAGAALLLELALKLPDLFVVRGKRRRIETVVEQARLPEHFEDAIGAKHGIFKLALADAALTVGEQIDNQPAQATGGLST